MYNLSGWRNHGVLVSFSFHPHSPTYFDVLTQTEPDFDQDIKEDVQEECSKFGEVKHIFVDK